MKNPTVFCLVLALVSTLVCCTGEQARHTAAMNAYNIIPYPAHLTAKRGQFQVNGDTKILLGSTDPGLKTAAAHLASLLIEATGITFAPMQGAEKKDAIHFSLDSTIAHDEGYRLLISPYGINIEAKTGAGAFYAVQTLRQLMPPEAETGKVNSLLLPCVEIEDAPRYAYRGMHLDVGRHFFPVDFIKKYIDLLALHKFNRFHWHLTEDQGWRLEIKKYPRLQEVAACRNETLLGHYNDQPQRFDGKKYCGCYTQEEAREIVRYAAERFITVIPEIEMPGHAQAAVAAYPELGCTGKPVQVATKWGIFEDVYCPNEATFRFLEEVLTEVMDIFPSPYIHIGGDECPKTQWKASRFCQDLIKKYNLKDEHGLQSYFIGRIEQFLNSKGRQIIGWDEILEGGLAPNATVMSWRGTEGGIAAARQRHDVIMTPTDFCYFDYYQSQDPGEPLAIGGYLPLDRVYHYEPTPTELTPEEAKHILGAQGNVWTEYLKDGAQVEYMAYPRACALAEVTWSPAEVRNFEHFTGRLTFHLKRLKALGVNAANHIFDVKTSVQAGDGKGIFVSLSPNIQGYDILYTLDGSEPAPGGRRYEKPIAIEKSGTLKAQTFEGNHPAGRAAGLVFQLHKAAGKAIRLTHPPAEKYSGNGPGSLLNGIRGSTERYGGAEWLGFEGKDLEAVIDFGAPTQVTAVTLRFFDAKGQWIYLPKQTIVSASKDGQQFEEIGRSSQMANLPASPMVAEQRLVFRKPATATQLKVAVVRFGIIPPGEQGAGHEAWLFVDEISVE